MFKTDVVIIGAGVVGLAICRELAQSGLDTVLVERNSSYGQETSSRNSEVIHGGMYYLSNSLKAKLCVEGRRMLYELCAKNHIPHRKTGKLICASEPQEEQGLERIFAQGLANGVEGLKLLSRSEVNSLEPDVRACAGLHSAETGIIDSHSLMNFLFQEAKDAGALCVFNAVVTALNRSAAGFSVAVLNNKETEELVCRVVVNSAGLDSDTVAQMAGIDPKKAGYYLHYCKGQYFRVSPAKAKFIKRLVYPVPQPASAGLGIHATLDIAGGMRLGPDTQYMIDKNQDYSFNSHKKQKFYDSAKQLLPFLEEFDLSPDTCGIRPKLQGDGEDFRDFVIKEESDRGLPGFINLIGIESPGLTACCAIARYVQSIITR